MFILFLLFLALLFSTTPTHADPGFDEKYERDYNIFNPASRYAPNNPLNPAQAFAPDNPFNPANRFDPGNPVNPRTKGDRLLIRNSFFSERKKRSTGGL